MKKDTHFHLLHYLVLVIILASAVVLFFAAAGNPKLQFKVAVGSGILYFVWGAAHHHLEGDLHPKIMVEYLLIALLAIFILYGAIYR